ncbi:hypothetical protein [Candidatus Poriferisodalis sp.]|uniref:hypothetical protein n=1 Tax=Candidatus Poriferisodalis sp. TaxID=3101277 RepID=UPI003C6F33E6
MTGHQDRLWLGDDGVATGNTHPMAYAYDLPGRTRAAADFELREYIDADFNVAGVNSNRGMATDGNYLWVADATSVVQAFRLFDDPDTPENDYGTNDTGRDLDFDDNGDSFRPFGLFTDGATMWAVATGETTAKALNLADGTRNTAAKFTLRTDNAIPYGIWSNAITMFVLDNADHKIYTYRIGDVEVSGAVVGGVAHVSAGG